MSIKSDDISEDYVITLSGSIHNQYEGDLVKFEKILPFRFFSFGPFNLRSQTPGKEYKTFIGEQKS